MYTGWVASKDMTLLSPAFLRLSMGLTHMLDSFPSIRFGLLVSIGDGVPSNEIDLKLGNIVINKPGNGYGGVV